MSKFAKTLSLWMLLCAWASAQTSGTISGYTKDPTGSFVPNVKVTVTNERTGATRSATSDDSGFYQVLALVSGVYTIEAEAQGFKKFRNTGVALTVDDNVRADVALEIGQMTESIEVTAQAGLIDTRSSQTSATIDDRRIVDLPLNGRNVFRLAATLPGVLTVSAPDNSDLGDTRTGPGMNVNGARANMNYNRFNGTYFNNPSRNTGMNVPPPDAIQEFKIQTSNFAADSGRNPGANVTIVSRQGTNTFHGALWEFHRNDNLNARSFFQTTKPSLIQNQYGASAGGPVVRDKAFVFGTFEIIDDRRQAATTNAFPPTSAEVAGNFSHLNGIKQLVNPFDNTPFPNNQIPTSLFDPAARKVLEFLPVVPGGSIQAVGLAPRDSELYMVRGDVNLTPKQSLFGHYYLNQNKIETIGLAYGSNIADWTSRNQGPRVQNAGINHTYTISPTLLSQLTLGYTRSYSLDALHRHAPSFGVRNSGHAGLHQRGLSSVQCHRSLLPGLGRAGEVRVQRIPGPGEPQLGAQPPYDPGWFRVHRPRLFPILSGAACLLVQRSADRRRYRDARRCDGRLPSGRLSAISGYKRRPEQRRRQLVYRGLYPGRFQGAGEPDSESWPALRAAHPVGRQVRSHQYRSSRCERPVAEDSHRAPWNALSRRSPARPL